MSTINCCVCSTNICLTDTQENELRQSHRSFYCPVGHVQAFTGPSDRDRVKTLEDEVAIQKRRAEMWRANYEQLNDAVRLCPWPDCGWETHAGWERVTKNILRHIEKAHEVRMTIPKRLQVVA